MTQRKRSKQSKRFESNFSTIQTSAAERDFGDVVRVAFHEYDHFGAERCVSGLVSLFYLPTTNAVCSVCYFVCNPAVYFDLKSRSTTPGIPGSNRNIAYRANASEFAVFNGVNTLKSSLANQIY